MKRFLYPPWPEIFQLRSSSTPKQAQRSRGPAGYGLICIVLRDYEEEKEKLDRNFDMACFGYPAELRMQCHIAVLSFFGP